MELRLRRRLFILAAIISILAIVRAEETDELARCCAIGTRHHREQKSCSGLSVETATPSCSRSASVCCLRASLERSCELGTEQGRGHGFCSSTVSVLGGGIRKECCDCCLLGREQREHDASCQVPIGFSTYCAQSFRSCCEPTSAEPAIAAPIDSSNANTAVEVALAAPMRDECRRAGCEQTCRVDEDDIAYCTCRAGYDLAPNGRSCVVTLRHACRTGHHRCDDATERCVPVNRRLYRCEQLQPPSTSAPIRVCASGYRLASNGSCVDINECADEGVCTEPYTQCLNSAGGYSCVCSLGFYWSSVGLACLDLDECLLLAHDCVEGQRCLNTPGSYKCIRTLSCGTGYALDSQTEQCVDVDECNLQINDCGSLYVCKNTPGSFRCVPKQCASHEAMDPITGECTSVKCPIGYVAREGRCEVPHSCGANEQCINEPGTFRCQERGNLCESGYKMDVESGFCLDRDECADGSHTCGGYQCINLPGSWKCRCAAGYEFNETTHLCEDVDECQRFRGHVCSPLATCENLIGSFVCHCLPGYHLNLDGRHCDDIDECANGEAQCEQDCINTPGSYVCTCQHGFQLAADGRRCDDLDECSTWARAGQLLCMGECENTRGSFRCSCPSGYLLQSDNVTCKDINECDEIGCPRADNLCINTLGSFRCETVECPKNYALDANYKNRCVRGPDACSGDEDAEEACSRMPIHISTQHIAIARFINISARRTSITLFSMRGPASPNSTMQFELRLISAEIEAANVKPAVRENFLIQKGDDRNSAIIVLRDSLDGPQIVHLELVLRLSGVGGVFRGQYLAHLYVNVSAQRQPTSQNALSSGAPRYEPRSFVF